MPDERGLARRVRERLEYAGLRAIVGLIRLLPVEAASSLGGRVWRALARHNRRHARALDNLAAAFPGLDLAERERIAMAMWDNIGRVMAEGFLLDRIAPDRERIALDLSPEAERALNDPRGCVIVSMHFGNWELAVAPLERHGLRTAGVYQRIKNPLVDAYVRRLRAPLYEGGLHAKSHNTARRAMAWVREGNVLALLADHRDNRGVVVPFFALPAPSTPFPALLARALDVPLLVGVCRREDGARFRASAEIVPVPRTGEREVDVALATARVQAHFEALIRRHPEQWMWGHKRWNRERAVDPRLAESVDENGGGRSVA